MSVPMSQKRGEEAVCFRSNVPLGAESEILETYLKYFATRGHYIIKVIECKDKDLDVDEE